MPSSPRRAPGVLLLIADDWSPLARCYGNDAVQTPHIDALAERATVFDHAFCTTPSCAASRASLLTGMYAHEHGQYGHCHGRHGFRTHEDLGSRTLPAVLKAGGGFTGLIGKDHIAPKSVYGFDFDERGNPWDNSSMRDMARRFFDAAEDRPFYLQAASMYPHRTPDGGFDRDVCSAMNAGDTDYAPGDVVVPPWLPDVPEVRGDLADYYRFVTRYDRFIGTMLEELERSGRLDDTLVLVLSDHGMPFPGAKASPYDSGHRCPLLVARPGGTARRSNALVNWCDLFPTACDFLDADASGLELEGRSLLPILDQTEPAGWDRTFFSHCFHEVTNYFPYRVVRERRLKYVRHLAPDLSLPLASDLFDSPTWQAVLHRRLDTMGVRETAKVLRHAPEELYDLDLDPHETTNLIDDPRFVNDVDRMRRELTELRSRTHDPWLEVERQAQLTAGAIADASAV